METNMTACDGSALPTCSPGWTGPSCAWPCDGAQCSFASYCHGDGRTWGLASFGARLFEARTSLPDQALHALCEQFIVANPEQVGLDAGISPQDLDIVPARVFRAPAGKLVVLRFDQRYRGIPVYGPDGTVRVTLAPSGAIAFDGAIVDGRQAWANREEQASEGSARRSILAHAVERSGLPAEDLELAGLRLVAVPRVQRIGWVGTVRSGLSHVATIVVDADPGASFPLSILHAERVEAAALVDEVDVSVLAEDPASDVFDPPDEAMTLAQLFDASPLRGSTRGAEEAVAQVFAIAATSALFPMATFDNCDPLFTISLGGDGAPHNDACRPGGEPYSHFLELPCPPGTGHLVATGLGLLGLVGTRRRRRRNRAGVGVLAMALVSSIAQGCCDPAVSTETSFEGGSSTTGESGSGDDPTETMGEPLPQWALGIFSSAVEEVGMSFSDNLYLWGNVEIDATGTFLLDMYVCAERQELQEFRWTLADDGRSLNIQPVPPADVFTFGNGHQVSEVIVEPGDSCDTIVVSYFHVEAMIWAPSEYHRGNVCARTTVPDGCAFTYEWCDGTPPPACE
jgi:hypothetical protein